jgi:leucyl aminopeptidase (aminopeptidase T)
MLMMILAPEELVALVRSVFPRFETDRALAILVDVPRDAKLDNPDWKERRRLAAEWHALLQSRKEEIPLVEVKLVAYPDVGSNNADLPADGFLLDGPMAEIAAELEQAGKRVSFEQVFSTTQLFLAPTEFSTTAPLKNAARRLRFRAATMPGFAAAMIPALRIDYGEVARRVDALKTRLDEADHADVSFTVDGKSEYGVHFDLRHRKAHASSGRFPELGTAGNLPSGEAYIVPYEGEAGEASLTAGTLPVEIGGEMVLFTIQANRAVEAAGAGPQARAERAHLVAEPAYGNMAELGFGVLADFGMEPIGEILLDEKLGLHVAFGRSDHFGGNVGAKDFSTAAAVIHLDRIYIPQAQPRVAVGSVTLGYPGGRSESVMADGAYTIF